METTTTYSPPTRRTEPVGVSNGHVTVACEHEDGTWTWNGFRYPDLAAARTAARSAGY